MMNLNLKGSEMVALLATLDPMGPGVGEVRTAWVPVTYFHMLMAVLQTGQLGGTAELNVQLLQAKDSNGTGANFISNKNYTQIMTGEEASNRQVIFNLKGEELDVEAGYGWVCLSLTMEFEGSTVAGQILGIGPRFAPAENFNQATVLAVI